MLLPLFLFRMEQLPEIKTVAIPVLLDLNQAFAQFCMKIFT